MRMKCLQLDNTQFLSKVNLYVTDSICHIFLCSSYTTGIEQTTTMTTSSTVSPIIELP